jgi:hypothetical protein
LFVWGTYCLNIRCFSSSGRQLTGAKGTLRREHTSSACPYMLGKVRLKGEFGEVGSVAISWTWDLEQW